MVTAIINAAGGGDYTTLQAWWNARYNSGTNETASISGSGDVGGLDSSVNPGGSFTYTITATAGNENNGNFSTGAVSNGAWSSTSGDDVNTSFVLRNLRLMCTHAEGGTIFTRGASGSVTIERCIITSTGTDACVWLFGVVSNATLDAAAALTFRNNIVVSAYPSGGGGGNTPNDISDVSGVSTPANCGDVKVHNNVFINLYAGAAPGDYYGFGGMSKGQYGFANYFFENNYIYTADNGVAALSLSPMSGFGGTGALTINNCATSDNSADDFGGTGHLLSKSLATCFASGSDNYALAAASPLLNAGKTLSGTTVDIANAARPQGAAYDIGAFETVVVAASGTKNLTLLGVG